MRLLKNYVNGSNYIPLSSSNHVFKETLWVALLEYVTLSVCSQGVGVTGLSERHDLWCWTPCYGFLRGTQVCTHAARTRWRHVPCLRESFELKKSLNLQMLRFAHCQNGLWDDFYNWTEVETPESPEEPQRSFWEFYLWLQLSNSIKYLVDGTLVFSSTNVFVRINGPYHPLQLQSLY